jgi:hypothetical protein
MTVAAAETEGERGALRTDIAIVGTVSAAHFCSHFYQFTRASRPNTASASPSSASS